MDLAELFNRYGTDKDIIGYTPVYHALFDRLRQQRWSILEIGIGTMVPGVHSSMVGYSLPGYRPGGSLRAWRDYFPNSTIYGVDIQDDTQFTEERITTFLCDSTDARQVDDLFRRLNISLDIIIDDGSHIDTDQLQTLKNFYPHLNEGGFYVVEDIHPDGAILSCPESLEPFCERDPMFFSGRKTTMCVIYKNHLRRSTSGYSY